MKVRVTEDHIKRGIPGLGEQCPIALALRDCGWRAAIVTDRHWWPHPAKWIPLTADALRFVRDFDRKDPVEPFEFEAMP